MRDDFKKCIKEKMARRVGFQCSLCQRNTVGPGRESDEVVDIGVAAHICAASKGGPRYDSSMSSDERKAINNGIWLCQNCAHLVDSDVKTFSVEKLREIKNVAENRASQKLSEYWNIYSVSQEDSLSLSICNDIIGRTKVLVNGGICIREKSEKHIVGKNITYDRSLYKVCSVMNRAYSDLLCISYQNSIQIIRLGIESDISFIDNKMPRYYAVGENEDIAHMIKTDCEYHDFFCSESGKEFIENCTLMIEKVKKSMKYPTVNEVDEVSRDE